MRTFRRVLAILIGNTDRLAMPVTPGVRSGPAARGGVVSIYATGLGATEPPVASGQLSPGGPLAIVTATPTVQIGGQNAAVSFAGLAPGFVGVYQVNAEVPGGISPGDAVPVVMIQGGVESNTATIAVE
jgi:adhesin/invasin